MEGRKCVVTMTGDDNKKHDVPMLFLQFGISYVEYQDPRTQPPTQFTTAIVQQYNGEVMEVLPQQVRFTDVSD